MADIRARLLSNVFALLYSRLLLLHEVAGWMVCGRAWHCRRLRCLPQTQRADTIVDIGAGEGRLIGEAQRRMIPLAGYDPSPQMRSSAARRSSLVQRGTSFDIPVADGSVQLVVSTYPGNWILDRRSWDELERVVARDGVVVVLLGGTYVRGPGAIVRRLLTHTFYGRRDIRPEGVAIPSTEGFSTRSTRHCDQWGTYVLLRAERCPG